MRKWLERGKLTHHGHDYYGRAIIDLDGVTVTPDDDAQEQVANARTPRASASLPPHCYA